MILCTDTRYIHLLFNNPLLSLFELVLRHFTNITILTNLAALPHCSDSIHFSDTSVTSHCHPNTHPTCFYTSITTLLFVLLVSVQRIAEPLGLSLQSLRSHRSHTHCTSFGFWVLLLCTALVRLLSVYQWHVQVPGFFFGYPCWFIKTSLVCVE